MNKQKAIHLGYVARANNCNRVPHLKPPWDMYWLAGWDKANDCIKAEEAERKRLKNLKTPRTSDKSVISRNKQIFLDKNGPHALDNEGRPWLPEDHSRLLDMWFADTPWNDIQKALKRPYRGVDTMHWKLFACDAVYVPVHECRTNRTKKPWTVKDRDALRKAISDTAIRNQLKNIGGFSPAYIASTLARSEDEVIEHLLDVLEKYGKKGIASAVRAGIEYPRDEETIAAWNERLIEQHGLRKKNLAFF